MKDDCAIPNIGNAFPPKTLFNEESVPGPEYRVRAVQRFVVTRYCHPYLSKDGSHGSSGHSEVIGEFSNEHRAYSIASALAGSEMTGDRPPSTVSV